MLKWSKWQYEFAVKAAETWDHRHGAHFGCAHERNSVRDGCAARLSRGSGRWESCSGTGQRFHRIRRGIPACPPRCFARRVGAAAHAVAASGEPDERRLSTALCGARNAGEYGRRPGFLDRLPRRCNPARVALVHLSDGFMLKKRMKDLLTELRRMPINRQFSFDVILRIGHQRLK